MSCPHKDIFYFSVRSFDQKYRLEMANIEPAFKRKINAFYSSKSFKNDIIAAIVSQN